MFLWRADLASNPRAAMPESKTNTLEVLIMNTKFKISRQAVLTISVLLTAMWLPLTTFAQDFSKTGDLTQGTNTLAETCAHCQTKHHSHDLRDCHHLHGASAFSTGFGDWVSEETVGFAETDPAVQQFEEVVVGTQISSHLVQQISVGFSETDPAINQPLESVTVLSASNSPAQQVSVGFSETDPAINTHRSIVELRSQHLVNCHGENAKDAVLVTPKFSNLTEKGNQHEIS